MKESEEKKIKSELEAIVKRINKIVKNIDALSPEKEKEAESEKSDP